MKLGKWQFGQLKETGPADTFDPVVESFPVTRIILVSLQDFLHDRGGLGPAWRIIGDACGDQFLEGRFTACIGVIAADPDRRFCASPGHRR